MNTICKILIILVLQSTCVGQKIVDVSEYTNQLNLTPNLYYKDLNNIFSSYIGTWENTTGNITFRLILWKVTQDPNPNSVNSFMDRIFGKYLIIQNVGSTNEHKLYNSVKYFPQSNTTTNWSLMGKASNNTLSDGYFEDTNANNGTGILTSGYSLEILNFGSLPLQARWEITSTKHLQPGESFTVPTNCILTKQ